MLLGGWGASVQVEKRDLGADAFSVRILRAASIRSRGSSIRSASRMATSPTWPSWALTMRRIPLRLETESPVTDHQRPARSGSSTGVISTSGRPAGDGRPSSGSNGVASSVT